MKCPICRKEISSELLKDKNGNYMCEECYIRIQVRIANGDVSYDTSANITTTIPKNRLKKIKNVMRCGMEDIT